jgi:hypothetical protein
MQFLSSLLPVFSASKNDEQIKRSAYMRLYYNEQHSTYVAENRATLVAVKINLSDIRHVEDTSQHQSSNAFDADLTEWLNDFNTLYNKDNAKMIDHILDECLKYQLLGTIIQKNATSGIFIGSTYFNFKQSADYAQWDKTTLNKILLNSLQENQQVFFLKALYLTTRLEHMCQAQAGLLQKSYEVSSMVNINTDNEFLYNDQTFENGQAFNTYCSLQTEKSDAIKQNLKTIQDKRREWHRALMYQSDKLSSSNIRLLSNQDGLYIMIDAHIFKLYERYIDNVSEIDPLQHLKSCFATLSLALQIQITTALAVREVLQSLQPEHNNILQAIHSNVKKVADAILDVPNFLAPTVNPTYETEPSQRVDAQQPSSNNESACIVHDDAIRVESALSETLPQEINACPHISVQLQQSTCNLQPASQPQPESTLFLRVAQKVRAVIQEAQDNLGNISLFKHYTVPLIQQLWQSPAQPLLDNVVPLDVQQYLTQKPSCDTLSFDAQDTVVAEKHALRLYQYCVNHQILNSKTTPFSNNPPLLLKTYQQLYGLIKSNQGLLHNDQPNPCVPPCKIVQKIWETVCTVSELNSDKNKAVHELNQYLLQHNYHLLCAEDFQRQITMGDFKQLLFLTGILQGENMPEQPQAHDFLRYLPNAVLIRFKHTESMVLNDETLASHGAMAWLNMIMLNGATTAEFTQDTTSIEDVLRVLHSCANLEVVIHLMRSLSFYWITASTLIHILKLDFTQRDSIATIQSSLFYDAIDAIDALSSQTVKWLPALARNNWMEGFLPTILVNLMLKQKEYHTINTQVSSVSLNEEGDFYTLQAILCNIPKGPSGLLYLCYWLDKIGQHDRLKGYQATLLQHIQRQHQLFIQQNNHGFNFSWDMSCWVSENIPSASIIPLEAPIDTHHDDLDDAFFLDDSVALTTCLDDHPVSLFCKNYRTEIKRMARGSYTPEAWLQMKPRTFFAGITTHIQSIGDTALTLNEEDLNNLTYFWNAHYAYHDHHQPCSHQRQQEPFDALLKEVIWHMALALKSPSLIRKYWQNEHPHKILTHVQEHLLNLPSKSHANIRAIIKQWKHSNMEAFGEACVTYLQSCKVSNQAILTILQSAPKKPSESITVPDTELLPPSIGFINPDSLYTQNDRYKMFNSLPPVMASIWSELLERSFPQDEALFNIFKAIYEHQSFTAKTLITQWLGDTSVANIMQNKISTWQKSGVWKRCGDNFHTPDDVQSAYLANGYSQHDYDDQALKASVMMFLGIPASQPDYTDAEKDRRKRMIRGAYNGLYTVMLDDPFHRQICRSVLEKGCYTITSYNRITGCVTTALLLLSALLLAVITYCGACPLLLKWLVSLGMSCSALPHTLIAVMAIIGILLTCLALYINCTNFKDYSLTPAMINPIPLKRGIITMGTGVVVLSGMLCLLIAYTFAWFPKWTQWLTQYIAPMLCRSLSQVAIMSIIVLSLVWVICVAILICLLCNHYHPPAQPYVALPSEFIKDSVQSL